MIKHIAAAALSLTLLGTLGVVHADDGLDRRDVKHVLLISVDGLHALDLTNYVAAHPSSALAETNFQAVSVGEKLAVDPVTGATGGYTDVLGTPGPGLASELAFLDQSLGSMIAELKKQGHFDSTLIIIAAKHGQSPIDVSKRRGVA
jgi:hypothetical protein